MKIIDKLYYQLDVRAWEYEKWILNLLEEVLEFLGDTAGSPFDDVVREAFIDRLVEERLLECDRLELDWSYTDMNELVEFHLKRKCVSSYQQ